MSANDDNKRCGQLATYIPQKYKGISPGIVCINEWLRQLKKSPDEEDDNKFDYTMLRRRIFILIHKIFKNLVLLTG